MHLVDLFCGCGGFSSGAELAGFSPTLAVDVDQILTSSFHHNHPRTRLAIQDIALLSGADIKRELGERVGGIFGGPPCQAFSAMGHRRTDDPRRSLLGHFYRLVSELQPKFFVMENVEGLGYSDARPELEAALSILPSRYRLVGPLVLDAADFGAPTRRRRLFVIGYDPSEVDSIAEIDLDEFRKAPTTVHQAIADLASASPVGTHDGFDVWQLSETALEGSYASGLRAKDGRFTGHRRTTHRDDVVERFRALAQGEVDTVGRYPRLRWDGQCPTLRAGTGRDRGSFQAVRPIHPTEPRVITVREAARLQGFRDDFVFHPTIWHSFRMIGNSVSPVIAKAIFGLLRKKSEVVRWSPEAAE
ncbi:DNA cytosine methyltransferase [Sinorhizobium sp. GL28]|uniref:DNA cytosine methyltransferase n=1 Tax=Sinorhizobium sp. GL28 TaxID=1358418 RepID=UPI00071DA2CD|nr:DNA cytosine methyltransferase [Sinorhizobium sp. GL28]KSV85615.1 hypothetical protein N184_32905 [Sinorhizobium sp. GL28]